MPTIRAALLLAAAGACAGPIQAQTIWRCGDSYSQQPCANGTPIPGAPVPNRDDRNQASAAAARDARLAEAMEKDRLRRESQAARPSTPPAQAQPESDYQRPEQAGLRRADVFTARVPGTGHVKGKSRHGHRAKAAANKDGNENKGAKAPTINPQGPAADRSRRS